MIVEITCVGFNAEDDSTDDRIIWVIAPDVATVENLLDSIQHLSVQSTDLDEDEDEESVDFDLNAKGQILAMQNAVSAFSNTPEEL